MSAQQFIKQLEELSEKATPGPWRVLDDFEGKRRGIQFRQDGGMFLHAQMQNNEGTAQLIVFLANNRQPIIDLVRAAEQEHGGNHHEPECPICCALASLKAST